MVSIALETINTAGIIVAHPDDETLWAGGLILLHPQWQWSIFTLCRGDDQERAPRFARALAHYGATGAMDVLDDGPAQHALPVAVVQQAIQRLCAGCRFDLVLTHGPQGEYTAHQRHNEVSRAVQALWQTGALTATQLAVFAYEDGERAYLPRPREDANWRISLPDDIWRRKYGIIHDLYGFAHDSWEARTTPREEAFHIIQQHKAHR